MSRCPSWAAARCVRRANGLWPATGRDGFSPVFTSPLIRAAEGARIIAGEDAAAITIEELVEVDFGLFEGLTADEIAERYPQEFRRWNANRLASDFVYPEGESRAGFVARVARGTVRMLGVWHDAHASGRAGANALLVAHRGVIRAVVRQLTGVFEPHIDLGFDPHSESGAGWRGFAHRAMASGRPGPHRASGGWRKNGWLN